MEPAPRDARFTEVCGFSHVAPSSQQQIGARRPQGQPLDFGMMTPAATPQQPQHLLSYLPQRPHLPSHVSQQHVDPLPVQHERQLPHQRAQMQQQNGQQQNGPNELHDGQQSISARRSAWRMGASCIMR